MVVGFLILLLFQLIGEVIVYMMAIPVPGAVVGLVLLLVALMFYGRVPDSLRVSAEGLLSILPLMLVPAGVGLMVHFKLIAEEWLGITVALFVSTFLALVVVTGLLKVMHRRGDEDVADGEDA